ncbi:hypothetical protein AUTU_40420 (plasmid) [Aureibacter tunicatorum]|nr:hypothetical protein AUTU_40420 [Aureibacter tunicatorum]
MQFFLTACPPVEESIYYYEYSSIELKSYHIDNDSIALENVANQKALMLDFKFNLKESLADTYSNKSFINNFLFQSALAWSRRESRHIITDPIERIDIIAIAEDGSSKALNDYLSVLYKQESIELDKWLEMLNYQVAEEYFRRNDLGYLVLLFDDTDIKRIKVNVVLESGKLLTDSIDADII